jgi:hypothetical protein
VWVLVIYLYLGSFPMDEVLELDDPYGWAFTGATPGL